MQYRESWSNRNNCDTNVLLSWFSTLKCYYMSHDIHIFLIFLCEIQSNLPIVVTFIKRTPFNCPVIENFIWIKPLLRGHLSWKTFFFLRLHFDLLIQVWLYYYTECLIVQVICQNITVPNITTETYTKYNNTFCCPCGHLY